MSQDSLSSNALLPNGKAFAHSAQLCKSLLKDLFIKTFEGVGLENTKKMAPKNTFLEGMYTLKSFVSFGFTQNLQPNLSLKQQKDFRPPQIDNLAVQQIDSQKTTHDSLPQIVQQTACIKSKLRTKKTGNSSVRSRKFTQISEQAQQIKHKQLQHFQKLPEVVNQFDFSQDPDLNKIRHTYFNIEKEKQQREKQLKALRQRSLIDKQKSQKIVKQMKRITFDYSGKLFGQANGNSQPEKLIKIKNEFGTMKKTINKTSKNIEQTRIETHRKRDTRMQRKDLKQGPMFREKAHSIIQNIENSKGISVGVKITEQLGEKKSAMKQNRLKKASVHSLAEFKNTIKQSRFRQYHPGSLNKEKSSLNISTINNEQTSRTKLDGFSVRTFNKELKSKSSYSLIENNKNKSFDHLGDFESSMVDGEMEKKCEKKVKYRGLPFIKSKGYKCIDIDSKKSLKWIGDEKGESSGAKIRSRILINDINLLKVTLEDL